MNELEYIGEKVRIKVRPVKSSDVDDKLRCLVLNERRIAIGIDNALPQALADLSLGRAHSKRFPTFVYHLLEHRQAKHHDEPVHENVYKINSCHMDLVGQMCAY